MKAEVNSLGEEQMGKLGEDKDEEEKPATERMREFTDLGLDLGEKEDRVACNASVLAVTMIDEACWKAEM